MASSITAIPVKSRSGSMAYHLTYIRYTSTNSDSFDGSSEYFTSLQIYNRNNPVHSLFDLYLQKYMQIERHKET